MTRFVFQIGMLLGLLVSSSRVIGQVYDSPFAPRKGLPLIRNYSPQEYQAHEQIWDIAQHPDGRMFFANGDGLLAYDNERWQLITLSNRSHVRSMEFAEDSTLYIGGDGDLGYLNIDEANQMEFISLLSKLPTEQQNFGRVRSTIPLENNVFFQADNYLFIWEGEEFSTYTFEEGLSRLFLINNEIYAQLGNSGLVRWQGEHFYPASQQKIFKEKRIQYLLDWDDNTLLAGTNDDQLFLVKDEKVRPFATQASLLGIDPEKGVLLDEQYLGLATNLGYVILDRQGNRVQTLTIESGLPSMDILNQFVDRDNNIWLGTQRGIAQILTGYPLSLLNSKTDLFGVLEEVKVYQNKLFAATREGLYILDSEISSPKFIRSPIFTDRIWGLHADEHYLLIGYANGIYEWRDDDFHFVGEYHIPSSFFTSEMQPNLLWVSVDEGLAALRRTEGEWEEVGKLETLDGSVRGLIEYQPGEVWLGTRAKGAYRLNFTLDQQGYPDFNQLTITSFGVSKGLPSGDVEPILVQDQLYAFAPQTNTWYRYEDTAECFESIDAGSLFGLENVTLRPQRSVDRGKALWLIGQDSVINRNFALHATLQPDDRFETEQYLVPYPLGSFRECLYASNDHLYFGGLEGILVLDRQYQYDTAFAPQPPVISSVVFKQKPISIVNSRINQLPYQKNAAIRVSFGAPLFAPYAKNSYRTKLVGFEGEWSEWGREPYKEYTNLWEGDYELLVQTANSFGVLSSPTRWQFSVSPPWYRQLWIYGAYLLCLVSLVYGLVTWRSSQLKKDKVRLETTVQERTAQLAEQRNQLAIQSEKLQELDQVKSRFFANISHEFRTPLTIILGIVNKHRQKVASPELQNDCQIMQRNANSLLRLINQLLELSRLEVGSARLSAQQQDIMAFVHQRVATFQSLADQKQIKFTLNQKPVADDIPIMPVPLYFDPEKMEQILTNLLANAIKYTPDQGWVDVSMRIEEAQLVIQFRNTGSGIPPDALPQVFERFFQASDRSQYEGTGIGLAIVKELTELHQGKVIAESIPNQHTTFTLKLPLGKDHIQSEEIVSATPTEENLVTEDSAVDEEITEPTTVIASNEKQPLLLIVEDNHDLRAFIRSQLEENYEVLEAADGEAGWDLAEEHLPDLIISDVMMPRLNGFDLCERLKTNEKTNHIPIILLTAKASRQDKLTGLVTGADDYLVKPFDAQELQTRITNLIHLRQQLREKFSSEALLKPSRVEVPSQQQVFLEKLHDLLEEHLDDEQFGVEALSEALGMSRTQTHRKIKAITNKAPSVLIRSYRLQRAVELIKQDVGNFSEIAYRTGFSSLSYFSRCFQDEYGYSPSEYKNQLPDLASS